MYGFHVSIRISKVSPVSVDVSGIDSVGQDKEITSRTCYNLQGQPVSANYRGPVICRTAYSDGTVKVTKMMNRN